MSTPASSSASACGMGPRHAVEDEALRAVGGGQALGDDADDDIVGDERAGIDVALGLEAHAGAGLHGGAQHIAR